MSVSALPFCQIPLWAAFFSPPGVFFGDARTRRAQPGRDVGRWVRYSCSLWTHGLLVRAFLRNPARPLQWSRVVARHTADLRRHAPMTGAVGSRSDADERRLVAAICSSHCDTSWCINATASFPLGAIAVVLSLWRFFAAYRGILQAPMTGAVVSRSDADGRRLVAAIAGRPLR